MDFTLDGEQTALRDAVRALLKGYDGEHRREVVAEDPGFDEALWGRLAEMGVLGLPFSEDDGGMGAGPAEVSVVAEEFGRVIAPEPFVEAVVLAGGLVAARGSDEQRKEILGGLSSGELLPAFAWSDPTGGEGGVTVDGDTLTGVKEPVVNGGRADVLVVFAEGQLFLVDAKQTERTSYQTFDGGRAARITFDKTPATPLGEGGDATEATKDVIAAATVAYCHEALGAMDSALKLTTDYLTTRKQFGVSLNRFQALTFRAADMYTSLELTRSIVIWATMVLADDASSAEKKREAAARAKLQVSRAGRHVGQEAIQLHGGIGMTAEYSVGHLTARLTAIDHLLGDGRQQVRNLSRRLTSYGVVEPLP
jgi:alkylation response protein AidB-like acyl-CoA dehydrogenase